MTARDKVKQLEELFIKNQIDPVDAEWIVCEITGLSRTCLGDKTISPSQEKSIDKVAKKRLKHVPIAHIFKKRNFYGFDLYITPDVLIPRFETEGLCELVASEYPTNILGTLNGLDLGTGSGAISIVLNKLFGYNMTAVDISSKALAVAKKNAKKLKADVRFVRSNMTDKVLGERFDFIVSNPPYIKSRELAALDKEVVNYEPHLALDGGGDGLQFYRKIIADAPYVLVDDGYLFFEVGKDRADEVIRLMKRDFYRIRTKQDLQGIERYVYGRLKESKKYEN